MNLPTRRHARLIAFVAILGLLRVSIAQGASGLTGQSGLVNMPDARIEEEGTWRLGLSDADPYFTIWSSITVLPRLELSARFTRIDGVPGGGEGSPFGNFRDKAFDAKLLLLNESTYLPAVSIGTQDFTGTRLFAADFIALSKRFDDLDATLGYGSGRIDGAFGGIRYNPSWHKRLGWLWNTMPMTTRTISRRACRGPIVAAGARPTRWSTD